jgi:hypothetical protein
VKQDKIKKTNLFPVELAPTLPSTGCAGIFKQSMGAKNQVGPPEGRWDIVFFYYCLSFVDQPKNSVIVILFSFLKLHKEHQSLRFSVWIT